MSGVFDNKITWSQLLIFEDRLRAVLTCETKTGFEKSYARFNFIDTRQISTPP